MSNYRTIGRLVVSNSNIRSEQTFGFRGHAPQVCAVEELRQGAAKELRPARAVELRLCDEKELRLGAVGNPPKIWLLKSNFLGAAAASQFEKFCQIFSAHSTSCDFACGCVPANRNLKKFQNSFIIYIESEGKRKENSQLRTSIFLHFHAGFKEK